MREFSNYAQAQPSSARRLSSMKMGVDRQWTVVTIRSLSFAAFGNFWMLIGVEQQRRFTARGAAAFRTFRCAGVAEPNARRVLRSLEDWIRVIERSLLRHQSWLCCRAPGGLKCQCRPDAREHPSPKRARCCSTGCAISSRLITATSAGQIVPVQDAASPEQALGAAAPCDLQNFTVTSPRMIRGAAAPVVTLVKADWPKTKYCSLNKLSATSAMPYLSSVVFSPMRALTIQ